MRDHTPIKIEQFGGLWARGDEETCPYDHSTEIINLKFIESGLETRDGLEVAVGGSNILRMYYFPDASNAQEGFLVLKSDHKIYHIYGDSLENSFIVSNAITLMTDFAFLSKNGKAYISPTVIDNAGGVPGEFLYIYPGDNVTMMRKAGGTRITGSLTAANSGTAGNVEAGIHVFGVVAETDSGFQTQIGPATLPTVTADGTKKVDISTVAAGPSTTVKRFIVGSKAISTGLYTGNPKDYELFFIPGAVINNNTGGGSITVNFYDGELVDSAAHLLDLFADIPAGGGLGTYHNRMLIWGIGDDTTHYTNPTFVNEVLVSGPDDFESFDSIDGLLLIPRDGLGVTYCQEYRDILYVANFNRTYGFNDNGDAPSSWPSTVLDQGLGIAKKGISSIWTYGGINTESIIILNDQGVHVFTGTFNKPELSYKITDFWKTLNKSNLRNGAIHSFTDATNQLIYINIPQFNMVLIADYANGLTADKVRWSKWTFASAPNTISLFGKDNKLYIGMSTGIHYIKAAKTDDTISGSSAAAIPNPTNITAFINVPDQPEEDDNIYHFGAIRTRINGSGVVIPKLYSMDDITSNVLTNITLATSPGKEPITLANMITQRARLEFKTTAKDAHMIINRIIIYSKLMYSMYPA